MSATTESITLSEPLPLRAAWLVFNALQFAFTLAWTAAGITLALAVRALTGSTRVPFVGWYAKSMGMCFIERDGNRASMVRSLRAAGEIVKAGHVLCIFPE